MRGAPHSQQEPVMTMSLNFAQRPLACIRISTGTVNQSVRTHALSLVGAQSSTALEPPHLDVQLIRSLFLLFIHVYITSSLHVNANPLLSIAT